MRSGLNTHRLTYFLFSTLILTSLNLKLKKILPKKKIYKEREGTSYEKNKFELGSHIDQELALNWLDEPSRVLRRSNHSLFFIIYFDH